MYVHKKGLNFELKSSFDCWLLNLYISYTVNIPQLDHLQLGQDISIN